MFLITTAQCFIGESVKVDLPRPALIIDPRAISRENLGYSFSIVLHDNWTTIMITRNDDGLEGFKGPFSFRVYDPAIETVPRFDSTIYTYLGVEGELAPIDTTILLIDPSVKIIKEGAFMNCYAITSCMMYDGVIIIEDYAFAFCRAMKIVRFSRTLKSIGVWAFRQCQSLEAIFIPPSIEEMGQQVFEGCGNLTLLSLPHNINTSQMGVETLLRCDAFFEATQVRHYSSHFDDSNEIHRSILCFLRNLPTLHQIGLDINIHANTITDYINDHGSDGASIADHNGMTPLHIVSINPHADERVILTCFHANLNAIFNRDSRGNTPLEYLKVHHKMDVQTSLVSALCMHREIELMK